MSDQHLNNLVAEFDHALDNKHGPNLKFAEKVLVEIYNYAKDHPECRAELAARAKNVLAKDVAEAQHWMTKHGFPTVHLTDSHQHNSPLSGIQASVHFADQPVESSIDPIIPIGGAMGAAFRQFGQQGGGAAAESTAELGTAATEEVVAGATVDTVTLSEGGAALAASDALGATWLELAALLAI